MKHTFWKTASGKEAVKEFIKTLSLKEQDKIARQIFLLCEKGHTQLARQGDFEKVDKIGVWEFKIDYSKSHFRIFCGIENDIYVFLHIIRKKDNKLKNQDIELAVKRLTHYRLLKAL
jgi:phage-related protein